MTRNLKSLGLVLVAVFALSALAAQAASAANAHHFTTAEQITDLTGASEGPQVTKFGGATFICQTKTLTGTKSEATSTSLSVTATVPELHNGLSNCKLGAQNVRHVDNGCKNVLTSQTTPNPATSPRIDAPLHFNCGHPATSGSTTIEGAGIVLHISDTHANGDTVNQNLHGVKYTQIEKEGKKAITIDTSVHGIAYECTGGVNCAVVGLAPTGNNGIMTGLATLQAYKHGSVHNAANLVNLELNENVT